MGTHLTDSSTMPSQLQSMGFNLTDPVDQSSESAVLAQDGAVTIPDTAGHLFQFGPPGGGPLINCLQEHSEVSIDSGRCHFVKTDDFEEALDILTEHHRVVLCGPPGSGKTATGYALLRHFRKQGFTPFVIAHLRDLRQHISEDRKSVVLIDGALGVVRVNREQKADWHDAICSMMHFSKSGVCLLVFTVYPHVLRELRVLDAGTESPLVESMIHLRLIQSPLERNVKEQMITCHVKELNLNLDIQSTLIPKIIQRDDSGPAFPWCCRRLALKWHAVSDPSDIFTTPAEAHVPLLTRMIHDSEHGQPITAVLVLAMKGICTFLYEPRTVQPHLLELGLDCLSDFSLEEYADMLLGSYLEKVDTGYQLCSRVVYDAVGLALGRSFLLPIVLKVCDVRFLVQYVHTREIVSEFSIPIDVHSEACQLLMRRICDEIVRGYLPEISQHPSLQSPLFLVKFELFCQVTDVLPRLAFAVDRTYRKPLLYWSAWNESKILTQWCMQVMVKCKVNEKDMSRYLLATAFLRALLGDRTENEDALLQAILQRMKAMKVKQELHGPIKLPLPARDHLFAADLKCRFNLLLQQLHSMPLSYLNDTTRPIPTTLLNKSLTESVVRFDTSVKQWPFPLRLLADGKVGGKDEDGNTVLHVAAETGNVEACQFCINCGVSIEAQNSNGLVPPQLEKSNRERKGRVKTDGLSDFQRACRDGDDAGANALLCCAVSSMDTDSGKKTPLHFASASGRKHIVELLIRLKGDVNANNSVGCTPLWEASRSGHTDTAHVLIEHGARINVRDNDHCTPLHAACFFGHQGTAALLLEHKADIHARCKGPFTSVYLPDHYGHAQHRYADPRNYRLGDEHHETMMKFVQGMTALHIACKNGHSEVAALLIENKARVDTAALYRLTPLHAACIYVHSDTVEYLVEHGADIKARMEGGFQALHVASENGHIETVSSLLRHKADVNSRNDHHDTAFSLACENGHTCIADLLLQNGASAHIQSRGGFTPLHLTCEYGHTDTAIFLIERDAEVNVTSDDKYTPLYLACQNGHHETAEVLLSRGACVNMTNTSGATSLHAASIAGHLDTATVLVHHHANVSALTKTKVSPLHLASEHGHTEIVRLLLKHDSMTDAMTDLDLTSLHLACQNGHGPTADVLIQHGANVNFKSDKTGSTPLHAAITSGSLETVLLLLNSGVDLLSSPHYWGGATPLHLACQEDCSTIAAYLIQLGANVNAQHSDNLSTPLHGACENGHTDAARVLIQYNADVNATDSDGSTPLHLACENGHLGVAELVIRHGAALDAVRMTDGFFPLHDACNSGHQRIVDLLLVKNAKLNAESNDKATPLYLACHKGYDKIAQKLMTEGADVNAQTKQGSTPLHAACEGGHVNIVSCLLQHGDLMSVRNRAGFSPLDLAHLSDHEEIVKLLKPRISDEIMPSSSRKREYANTQWTSDPCRLRSDRAEPCADRMRPARGLNSFPDCYVNQARSSTSLQMSDRIRFVDSLQSDREWTDYDIKRLNIKLLRIKHFSDTTIGLYNSVCLKRPRYFHGREHSRLIVHTGRSRSIVRDRAFKPHYGVTRRHWQTERRATINNLSEYCAELSTVLVCLFALYLLVFLSVFLFR